MSIRMKVVNSVLKRTIKPILTYVPFHEKTVFVVRETVNVLTHFGLRPKSNYQTVKVKEGLFAEWVDYHSAKSPSVAKVILYLHGGGYLAGSPSTHRTITSALSKHTGASVFALDYRKAPEHKYPAALEDSADAYCYLIERGYKPENIAIAGDSAGGNLTLVLTRKILDSGIPSPASICCISPWCEMSGWDKFKGEDNDPMLPPSRISEAGRLYAGEHSLARTFISPKYQDFTGFPPTMFTSGELEVLRNQIADTFCRLMRHTKDTRHVYFKNKGCPHVFQLFYGIVPEANNSIRDISDFFIKHWR